MLAAALDRGRRALAWRSSALPAAGYVRPARLAGRRSGPSHLVSGSRGPAVTALAWPGPVTCGRRPGPAAQADNASRTAPRIVGA